jgi:hypothetical protein
MDEYAQADAPDEFAGPTPTTPPTNKWRKRATRGHRTAQVQRWRQRQPSHYRDYMRRYMASRRAAEHDVLPGHVAGDAVD